jgi:hypothetical protein
MRFRENGHTHAAIAVKEVPLRNHLDCKDQQQRKCQQDITSHETPQSLFVL